MTRMIVLGIAGLTGCDDAASSPNCPSWIASTASPNMTATTTSVDSTASGQAWVVHDWAGEGIFANEERIDADGSSASLAIGPDGNPRVAYQTADSVRAATREGDYLWAVESPVIGDHASPSIGVSSTGISHVAFVLGGLYEVVRTEAGWASAEVDPAAQGVPAIWVDGETPHIVYRTASGLSHATSDGATWSIEEVYAGEVAGAPSIAAGPRVSFAVPSAEGFEVWTATLEGSVWSAFSTAETTSTPQPRIAADGSVAYLAVAGDQTEARVLPPDGSESELVAIAPTLEGIAISSSGRAVSYATDEGVFLASWMGCPQP